ncbi:MAG: alpha/beta hydrolase [Anaerolineae bacterium]|nr:alpha/beta hydrolase [Gemmatimonadaceae bacterium]
MQRRQRLLRHFAREIIPLVALIGSCRTLPAPERVASASVSQGIAAVNGTTLWYEAAGQGAPVVLLHGGNLDHRMWDDQFARFAQSHRVVRYDARGFGRSGRADKPFAAHEDLFALLHHLGISRASLVGLSLGGRIAVDFTLAHPEMVDRLVLAGPGLSGWAWAPDSPDTLWNQDARGALARHDTVGVALAWLRSDYMRPAMEQPALAARLRTLAAENVGSWKDAFRHGDVESVVVPPAVSRLATLRASTLVIVGSRDVPDIQRIVDTLVATVPAARKLVVHGAGHMVNMEQPARFTAEVLAFLSR